MKIVAPTIEPGKSPSIGKSLHLVHWALAAPDGEYRVIVTVDAQAARSVFTLGRDLGLEREQVVEHARVDVVSRTARGRGRIVVAFDDADRLLLRLTRCPFPVELATVSSEIELLPAR